MMIQLYSGQVKIAKMLLLAMNLGLGLCLLSLSLGLPRAWGDSNYDRGVTAYKQKRYQEASGLLASSLKEDPGNAKGIFYLGLTYTQTGHYKEARSAFEQVIQMLPETDPLAAKARNNIGYITSSQMINVGNAGKANQLVRASLSQGGSNNYLTHVLNEGKIVRFDERRMPLKVYITDGKSVPGWNSGMRSLVSYATNAWQRASQGKIRFVITGNIDTADIVVRWQHDFKDNILGVSPYQSAGDTLIRSDVTLALYYSGSNQVIPMSEMQGIATHEFGHAIGLKGHSPYPEDLMYYSRNQKQTLALSSRDINTINMLYKFSADVKNSSTMSATQTQKYFDLFQKGVEAGKARQTAQAMLYYRQAVQLDGEQPEAKYNLSLLLLQDAQENIGQNRLLQADRDYDEAIPLLQSYVDSGKTLNGISRDSTLQLLTMARHNLQVIRQSHSQSAQAN